MRSPAASAVGVECRARHDVAIHRHRDPLAADAEQREQPARRSSRAESRAPRRSPEPSSGHRASSRPSYPTGFPRSNRALSISAAFPVGYKAARRSAGMSTRSADRGTDSRPTRALIDLGALADNWAIARRHAGARAVIAVVKADAYGHGAPAVARRLLREGCTAFAVATASELAALRAAGVDAAGAAARRRARRGRLRARRSHSARRRCCTTRRCASRSRTPRRRSVAARRSTSRSIRGCGGSAFRRAKPPS